MIFIAQAFKSMSKNENSILMYFMHEVSRRDEIQTLHIHTWHAFPKCLNFQNFSIHSTIHSFQNQLKPMKATVSGTSHIVNLNLCSLSLGLLCPNEPAVRLCDMHIFSLKCCKLMQFRIWIESWAKPLKLIPFASEKAKEKEWSMLML